MYAVKTRKYKESIVDSFYTATMDRPVIATILAGPRFNELATLAYERLDAIEINCYEIDGPTYEQQVFELQNVVAPEIAKISTLYLQDVNKCIVSNFMDIDLMGTILTQGNTIRQLLEQQSYLMGTKVFIGTFSIRRAGLDATINYIQNIIGLTLKSRVYIDKSQRVKESMGRLEFKHKLKASGSGRIQSVLVYQYSDKEGVMVTFRIVYR